MIVLFLFGDLRLEQSRPGFGEAFEIARQLILAHMYRLHDVCRQPDFANRLVLFILIFASENILQLIHVFTFSPTLSTLIQQGFVQFEAPGDIKRNKENCKIIGDREEELKCFLKKLKGLVELV